MFEVIKNFFKFKKSTAEPYPHESVSELVEKRGQRSGSIVDRKLTPRTHSALRANMAEKSTPPPATRRESDVL